MQPGQPKSADIRPATPADVPALSRSLALAFADDGMIDWLCGPRGGEADAIRNQRSAAFFAGLLQRLALPNGMSFTVPGCDGAALWAPPGAWQVGMLTQTQLFPSFVRTTGWRRLPGCFIGAQKILAAHPRAPHFYLQTLGVAPAAQGHGWGSQLLKHGLAQVDAAGMPAYLETMNGNNIAFYERHGFRLSGELRLPFFGNPVWFMWRAAQRG